MYSDINKDTYVHITLTFWNFLFYSLNFTWYSDKHIIHLQYFFLKKIMEIVNALRKPKKIKNMHCPFLIDFLTSNFFPLLLRQEINWQNSFKSLKFINWQIRLSKLFKGGFQKKKKILNPP